MRAALQFHKLLEDFSLQSVGSHHVLKSAFACSCVCHVSQGRGKDTGNFLTQNVRDLHRQLDL